MQDEEEEESKRLHVGGASNLEKSVAKLTDNASTLGEEVAKTKVQNTMQSDLELDVFDRLRSKRVQAQDGHTASAFLAEFQSTAASLEPDEKIELVVYAHKSGVELLKAVLADPQANKICALHWTYYEKEDVTPIIPLLINSCPELASLVVDFECHSAFDFVSSLLEHPSNKIKELDMLKYTKGDIPRFFAALGQSQVSALTLFYSPVCAQGLHEYLAKDLLVRLKLWTNFEQVPLELMVPLADHTRLTKLEMLQCEFSQPTAFTHLPKSITTLTLNECTFVGGLDWSFLADSNVRELNLDYVSGVDGNQFGGALAVHLGAKGLDKLRFFSCHFANETLIAVGVELGQIKMLEIYSNLSDASIKLIALALRSPDSELRELNLEYRNDTASSMENHLMPALKHPNCNLAKLSFRVYHPMHVETTQRVADMFRKRLALFVLLQGRRRYPCPLRRLPVEMLRLLRSAPQVDPPDDLVERFPFVRAMSCFVLHSRASGWKAVEVQTNSGAFLMAPTVYYALSPTTRSVLPRWTP
ncbi:hypothetical protein BASA81_015154 [Batrachochytrium salamandrivorans]|nr:hypothetical protein BASA81_015154 [Batrachochytrium salamandrivorans]